MFKRIVFVGVLFVMALVPGSAFASFGFKNFEVAFTNHDGSPDTQAGSHPFEMTTSFTLNTHEGTVEGETLTEGDLRNVVAELPAGLVGNTAAVPRCSQEQLTTDDLERAAVTGGYNTSSCENASAVGIAEVAISKFPSHVFVPLYSVTPPAGAPAAFGFSIQAVPVLLIPSVRSNGDYGIDVESHNTSQAVEVTVSSITIWGVPADPSHDELRGTCLFVGGGSTGEKCPANVPVEPLLTMPTACSGPLRTVIRATSWQGQEAQAESITHDASGTPVGINGCSRLHFEPTLSLRPEASTADTPTGTEARVSVPQIEDSEGLSETDVRGAVVTLPAGMTLSPSAGNGLEACSEEEIGLHSSEPALCPNASKIGSVTVETPLLEHPLTGGVYVAQQEYNPFGSLFALYVVAEGSGVRVKLAGKVEANEQTGQLTTRFIEVPSQKLIVPELPFSHFNLDLYGGPRAALATPHACGTYQANGVFASWSSLIEVGVNSEPAFTITTGCSGGFSPSLITGARSNQAGAFTPFTMTMSREDGQQSLDAIQLHMPAGLSGMLSGVELCGEVQADAGTCDPGSLIGETVVSVGLGGDPFSVTGGKVYLTGPYEGAPFGLSIVNPAKAGPFDLEATTKHHPLCDCLVVRAKIEVDPVTAGLTVTSDTIGAHAIPTIIEGIPLQIKHVNVTIDRPGFTFNPTDCDPLSITGNIQSKEGASSPVSVPFQVTNCATLGFRPSFKVFVSGRTSRRTGAGLHVKLAYPKAGFGSQANIKSVKVDLPKQLPSNLKTLQKACPDRVFSVNPAGCSAESRVGVARATTPILPVALTGPAYFVSHGGAKFPELVIVLSGYGVTVQLHSETFINEKTNVTSSTFRAVPDVPVGTFELTLPQGPYSALAANTNLCKVKGGLKMPTAFTAQNGLVIHQTTAIAVTGCASYRAHRGNVHQRKRLG